MSEDRGEKTEQPTQKRLDESWSRGQFARSPEIQTAMVLLAGLTALSVTGQGMWNGMAESVGLLGHLHETSLSLNSVQGQFALACLQFAKLVGPPVLAILGVGLLAGALQTRFKATPEALRFNWERINPLIGFKQVFGVGKAVPTLLGLVKISVVLSLSYSVIKGIVSDPIFFQTVDVARIAGFMAAATAKIGYRAVLALGVIAAADYGYQLWKTNQDMRMSREEVKEEAKSADGNPQMKGRMRSRRMKMSQRKMLAEVATADVIVTNPTHIAVALRYDRKSMKAPKIVAKGIRLNAVKIREIAQQHGVPIMENKPLARAMFKFGRIGGEIPAQLFTAVAEVLAWVYRVNAYRYYREQHS